MVRNVSWRKLLTFTAAVALSIGGFSSPSRADLVVNGGFETGDFTGWIEGGNTGFNGVQCPGPGATVAQGNCSYFAGPIGSNSTLSQNITTQPGTAYSISFSFDTDGLTPNHFVASFGGVTLLDVSNQAPSSFQNFNFVRTATASSTTLSFSFQDDPGFLFLDAVSVNAAAVPEPGTIALIGIGVVGILGTSYRKRR
jgi:PEP-CTERM motif